MSAENFALDISLALTLLLDVPDNAETHEAALNASAELTRLEQRMEAMRGALELWQEEKHRRGRKCNLKKVHGCAPCRILAALSPGGET